MENGEIVGTFQAADNGDYNMEFCQMVEIFIHC